MTEHETVDIPPLNQRTPGVPQGVFGDLRATVQPTRWGWSGNVTDGIMQGPYLWSFSERRLLRRIARHVRKREAEGARTRARREVAL